MASICFYAPFRKSGIGDNTQNPTWDVERITRATGARVALVTAAATNVIIGRRGLYGYLLAGADLNQYDYVATAISADATLDQRELTALWTLWAVGGTDLGSGSNAYVVTVKDPGLLPLDGAHVWVSTDLAGANVIASGYSDALGNVTFMLDAGNYFVWKQLAGYNFTNPEAFVVP